MLAIDRIQGRRFDRLTGEALAIASAGVIRHLRSCERMEVRPDVSAIREIIDDALKGRKIWEEPDKESQPPKPRQREGAARAALLAA